MNWTVLLLFWVINFFKVDHASGVRTTSYKMVVQYSPNLTIILIIKVDMLKFIEKKVHFFFQIWVFGTCAYPSPSFKRRPVEKGQYDQEYWCLQEVVECLFSLGLNTVEESCNSKGQKGIDEEEKVESWYFMSVDVNTKAVVTDEQNSSENSLCHSPNNKILSLADWVDPNYANCKW